MAEFDEHVVVHHYGIDLGGDFGRILFLECSGITSETEPIEHKVVTPDGREMIQMIPGRTKWQPITLKAGLTKTPALWNWRKLVIDGKVNQARKDGSLIMFDQEGKEIVRYNFERAWPTKVTGPGAKAAGSEVAVEEMTIVFEHIERK